MVRGAGAMLVLAMVLAMMAPVTEVAQVAEAASEAGATMARLVEAKAGMLMALQVAHSGSKTIQMADTCLAPDQRRTACILPAPSPG